MLSYMQVQSCLSWCRSTMEIVSPALLMENTRIWLSVVVVVSDAHCFLCATALGP